MSQLYESMKSAIAGGGKETAIPSGEHSICSSSSQRVSVCLGVKFFVVLIGEMGTGWRRSFCSNTRRDSKSNVSQEEQRSRAPSPTPSPRSSFKLGFLSGGNDASTPRSQLLTAAPTGLRCRTVAKDGLSTDQSETTPKTREGGKLVDSTPRSPRSPLKISLFKNSFKFRSSCGVCLNSAKTDIGTAIYTADCSHTFHFLCIATHVRKSGNLVCPLCNVDWKDAPLLAVHKNLGHVDAEKNQSDLESAKATESSPRALITLKEHGKLLQLPKKPLNSWSYDEDEPVVAPSGRIIPMSDQVDETGDFPGFFPNSNPSLDLKTGVGKQAKGRNLRSNVQVRILPDSALIYAGDSHETYVVALSVKASPPPSSPTYRAPIDLVTVLDLSERMTGAKLEMLKRAMRLVISSLISSDRLSIIAFSANPKRLLPLERMTVQGQRAACQVIDQLVCSDGNCVAEATRKAALVLENRREKNPVASIMLLLDGLDERFQNGDDCIDQLRWRSHERSIGFFHIEIPVTDFGFGEDGSFSHELAEVSFANCIGSLQSPVLQDLRIQLSFSDSSSVEVSAIHMTIGSSPVVCNSGCLRLGDLYADEERELLVELRIPTSAAGNHHPMSVRCLYKDAATQDVVFDREEVLVVPHPHVARASPCKTEKLKNMFITSRAVAESRSLIDAGDFLSAYNLLASAQALLSQSNSTPGGDKYVRTLEVEMAELHWQRHKELEEQHQMMTTTMIIEQSRYIDKETTTVVDENKDPATPKSASRAIDKLNNTTIAKLFRIRSVGDLHGFENARF